MITRMCPSHKILLRRKLIRLQEENDLKHTKNYQFSFILSLVQGLL